MVTYFRLYELPWETAREEELRFRKILKQVSIGIVVLSIVFSFMPLPEAEHDRIEKVPPRFAKLILDKPKPLPPPPVSRPLILLPRSPVPPRIPLPPPPAPLPPWPVARPRLGSPPLAS